MKNQSFTKAYRNPLKRGGLSRPDREHAALHPDQAPVDDRNLGHLLHFWQEYARQINYFSTDPVNEEGDWQPFFRRSVPFQYAAIAAHDLNAIEVRFTALKDSIGSRLTYESLNGLFDLLFEMTDRLAQWQSNLRDDEAGLRTTIEGLVETNLRSWTVRLIGLANAAGKWNYQPTLSLNNLILQFGINPAQRFGVERSILRLRGSLKHRVLAARDLLEEVYRVLWKATEAVVQTAQQEEKLERSLLAADLADHPAHLGLMFSFLLLFRKLQGSLNQLSTSHLDFFYRRTLQLAELPERVDRAHLVFELGKQVQEAVRVEKGTRFKAGPDAGGEEVFFELPEDHIVSPTKVGELRSLFIDQGDTGSLAPDRLYGVHAAPIANSADGQGGPFPKGDTPTWPTVGAAQHRAVDPVTGEPGPVAYPTARLGWLISGKVLVLREGERTIDLTITLDNTSLADYGYPAAGVPLFKLYLSTEEGWIPVPTSPNWELQGSQLIASINLPNDFPPVVYPAEAEKLGLAHFGHTQPMLKAEFDYEQAVLNKDKEVIQENEEGQPAVETVSETVSCYYALRTQTFTDIEVAVKVCDLRQIVVQNDLAVLDANKPFMPFGPVPKKNSSNFYIGSEELYCKKWEQVDITLRWKDKPAFPGHYDGYPTPPGDAAFTAQVALLRNKQFDLSSNTSIPLFGNEGAPELVCPPAETGNNTFHFSLLASNFPGSVAGEPGLDLSQGYTQDLPSGFFRLQLGAQDFLHDQYAQVLLAAALGIPDVKEFGDDLTEIQNQISQIETHLDEMRFSSATYPANTNFNIISKNTINSAEDLSDTALSLAGDLVSQFGTIDPPNPPYTPLLESIRLDYKAADTYGTGELQLTHLHPWERTYEQVLDKRVAGPEASTDSAALLPCFLDEGALYVGLDQYTPGELLNLYFNLDPATADPTVDKALVCWEYLRGNSWYPLRADAEVLSDTTQGLIRPGIVTLAVPTKISSEGTTILPSGKHWIKARVHLRTAAVCESQLVATQAAEVIYAPNPANDPTRLASTLAAGSIAKLAAPVAGIKGVEQPANGFGGRAPEVPQAYYGRISEHLRHKGRAITLNDFERLILSEFPQIYRVKCLNHTLGRRGQQEDYELSPGFVTLVVVPDLTRLPAPDIFQPRVPASDLQAIKDFLAERTSPFLRLEVLNPIYQPVRVKATVRFREGKSPTFYREQLQQDLRTYLAPWSGADPGADITFGGGVYYSSVLHFVEELPYVAHVLELSLIDVVDPLMLERERIEARRARTVLTTDQDHHLFLDESDAADALRPKTGIGYDFKILN